jgi:hypothetical protein
MLYFADLFGIKHKDIEVGGGIHMLLEHVVELTAALEATLYSATSGSKIFLNDFDKGEDNDV